MKAAKLSLLIACAFAVAILVSHRSQNKPEKSHRTTLSEQTSPMAGTNAARMDPALADWAKGVWETNSFNRGMEFARTGEPRERVLALQKIFSKRQSMSAGELSDFRILLAKQIRDTTDAPYVVAASIRTLAGLLDFQKAKGLVSQAEVMTEGSVLLAYMSDSTLDLQIRGAAIRAMGDLGITSGRKPIEDMLSDAANGNTAEIARNGCLALVKLAGEESLTPIRGVFERTSDAAIFGTAAFCLGQIQNVEAMSALVENSRRFPDSESCDAALVNMDKVILRALGQPDSPAVIRAIQATEHLWKDSQREKYVPALRGLLAESSLAVKSASCERLIEVASRLPLEQEKQELAVILESIGQSPELREYGERIRQRMSATVLVPATVSSLVPTVRK